MQSPTRKLRILLNVYDLVALKDINEKIGWMGLGGFHSGVVLFDQEFSFGYHPYDSTGVFTSKPGVVPDCVLRETIDLGEVEVTPSFLKATLEKLSKAYPGNSYHVLKRNCNHFSDDLVTELLGSGIPNWVNRTSWWLVMLECCIPAKYFPKTPGSELSDEVTGTCSNCSCGHSQDDWGQGKSLDDGGTYSPLPQDPVERRMAVKNAVMARNSIHQ